MLFFSLSKTKQEHLLIASLFNKTENLSAMSKKGAKGRNSSIGTVFDTCPLDSLDSMDEIFFCSTDVRQIFSKAVLPHPSIPLLFVAMATTKISEDIKIIGGNSLQKVSILKNFRLCGKKQKNFFC